MTTKIGFNNDLLRTADIGNTEADTAHIAMTTNGEVTKPLQPAFLGNLASNDLNVTGNGTYYVLGTNTALTEIFDQSGDYDPGGAGAATFTAPVTGRYYLGAHMRLQNATGTIDKILEITTSNRTYGERSDSDGNSNQSAFIAAIADMDAADTATFRIFATGVGSDTADLISSSNQTSVFGALIC